MESRGKNQRRGPQARPRAWRVVPDDLRAPIRRQQQQSRRVNAGYVDPWSRRYQTRPRAQPRRTVRRVDGMPRFGPANVRRQQQQVANARYTNAGRGHLSQRPPQKPPGPGPSPRAPASRNSAPPPKQSATAEQGTGGSPEHAQQLEFEKWIAEVLESAKNLSTVEDFKGALASIKSNTALHEDAKKQLAQLILEDAIDNRALAANDAPLHPVQLLATYYEKKQPMSDGINRALDDPSDAAADERKLLREWMRTQDVNQVDFNEAMQQRDLKVLNTIANRNGNSRTLGELGLAAREGLTKLRKHTPIGEGKVRLAWSQFEAKMRGTPLIKEFFGGSTSPGVLKPIVKALNDTAQELKKRPTNLSVQSEIAIVENVSNLVQTTLEMHALVEQRQLGDINSSLQMYREMLKKVNGRSLNTLMACEDFSGMKRTWDAGNTVQGNALLAVFDHVSKGARKDMLSDNSNDRVRRQDIAADEGAFLKGHLPQADWKFVYNLLTDNQFLGTMRINEPTSELQKFRERVNPARVGISR
jgi:hypothetical protein